MNGISQGPWALQVAPGDSAGAVKVVSATGGVVALMKAAGGRKMQNGRAVAEVPALIAALREARQWIAKGVADGAYSGCAAPLAPNRWLDRCGAILSRIDGAGEEETACASCGAEEGESHGANCESRGFSLGVAARRGDTLPDAPVPAPTSEAKPHLFTVIWGNIGDDNGKRLDHVSVESADQNLIMDAAFECFFKDLERSGQTLTAEDREEFRHNTAYDGYAVLPGHVTDAPGMGFF